MVKRDSEARRVVLVRQEYIEQVAPEESAENSVWWFYGWLKGKLPGIAPYRTRRPHQHLKSDLKGIL